MYKMLKIKDAAKLTGLSEGELRKGFIIGKYPGMRLGNGTGKIVFNETLLLNAIDQIMLANIASNTDIAK